MPTGSVYDRGSVRLEVLRSARVVGADERIVVPAMARHTAQNASAADEAVVTWIVRPALRTEQLFAALYDRRRRGGGALSGGAAER